MDKEKLDIAVIGIGVYFPKCKNVEEYWDVLQNGICCTTKFPVQRQEQVEDTAKSLIKEGDDPVFYEGAYLDSIDEFDYEYFKMFPKSASLIDPVQRIIMEVVVKTIEDAGYSMDSVRGAKIGNFVGYSSSSFKDSYLYNIFTENKELVQYSIIGNITALIPSRIAQLYDFRGPALVVNSACSSSLVAVHEACASIQNHASDMALACGIKLQFMPINDSAFKLGIESSDGKTRVFDALADGSGIGEGIGAVLLKPLKDAIRDKDRIYSVIKGSAINHDGTAIGLTAPNPVAQTGVILEAWKQADIDIDKMQYIEMHGTATTLGDPIEFQGLNKAFSQFTDKKQICAVGSVKSNFGHLYEAAGIASFIKASLAVYKGVIPATLNFNSPNSKIQLIQSALYINTENQKWEEKVEDRTAGISAFGLSGTNCHVVISGYENEKEISRKNQRQSNLLFCFSAHSINSLIAYLKEYHSYLRNLDSSVTLGQLSFCTNIRCNILRYRLCVYAKDFEDLSNKILLAANKVLDVEKANENKTVKISMGIQFFKDMKDKAVGRKIQYENIILPEVAKGFLEGHFIDWESVFKKKYNKISLPLYSFLPNKLWFSKDKKMELNELYRKKWVPTIHPLTKKEYNNLLILDFCDGIGTKIKDKISIECSNVLVINSFQYALTKILEDTQIDLIIYCMNIMEEDSNNCDGKYEDVDNLFLLCKSLRDDISTDIVVIGINTYSVNDKEDMLRPKNSLLYGLGSCISKEKRLLHFKGIDIGSLDDLEELPREILYGCHDEIVAYRSGVKYIESIEKYRGRDSKEQYRIHTDGVYLITGGMGGVGFEIAQYLAKISSHIRVVLIGRSGLFDTCLSDENKRRLLHLQQINEHIEYIPCDITNEDNMDKTFTYIYKNYNQLNGIFHVAGIVGGGNLDHLTRSKMHNVMGAKVDGTILIDKMTKDNELDFLVLFSSIATIFSSPLLVDYTAANAFLDAYAQYFNRSRKGRCISINWTTWSETGMSKANSFTIDTLFKSVKSERAIILLQNVLGMPVENIIVGELNLNSKIALTLKKYPYQYSDEIEEKLKALVSCEETNVEILISKEVNSDNTEISQNAYRDIEKNVIQVCYDLLGYENIDINKNFFELGADSIMLGHLHTKLNSIYPNALKITDIFMNPSVMQISRFIEEKAEPMKEIVAECTKDDKATGIAIIGMAMKLPNAENEEEYWKILTNGIDTVKNISEDRKKILQNSNVLFQNKGEKRYKKASYINDIDKFDFALFGISPNDALLMDPVSRLFLQCCWSALEDAGYGGSSLNDSNTGVFLGYSANLANMYSRLLYENDPNLFADSLAINQVSMMGSRISYIKNFHGPSMVIDTACSSSLVSVNTACENIISGKCNIALAGGASLMLMPYDNGMGVGYESPDCRTRAFCKNSNGSAIGEGIAVVVLKRLDEAIRDNDDIYAVIKGGAVNQDGSSFGIAAPNLQAQSQVVQNAWKTAKINPEDISYIETHGTGTVLGDSIEIAGLQDAFSKYTNHKQFCAIGSVKNNLGHLNEASGMTGLIKLVLMLKNHTIVPTIHNAYPNTAIDWMNSSLYLEDRIEAWISDKKLLAGISGFGMSGTNCHIVLEEAPKRSNQSSSQDTYFILFSAKTKESLYELIKRWSKYIEYADALLDEISYTLSCGRMHLENRIGFLVHTYSDFKEKMTYLLEHFSDETLLDYIYRGSYHIIPESKTVRFNGDITVKEKEQMEKDIKKSIKNCVANDETYRKNILKAYVNGANIPWDLLFHEFKGVAHLPTYPFAKNKVWIPFKETRDSYFHGKKWIEMKGSTSRLSTKDCIVFIHWDNVDVSSIIEKISETASHLIEVNICGHEHDIKIKKSGDKYFVKPKREEFIELFLSIKQFSVNKIVYIPITNEMKTNSDLVDEYYDTCFYVPIDIGKALVNAHYEQEIDFYFITMLTFLITETEESVNPQYAMSIGLARVIDQEFPTLKMGIVDVESLLQAQQIVYEIGNGITKDFVIGYRSDKRYVEVIYDIDVDENTTYRFNENGVYLVTGGTSGMGLEFATYLSINGCKNIVLISRKNPLLMKGEKGAAEQEQRVEKLKILQSKTENLHIYECDLSNRDMLKDTIDKIHTECGRIQGVFHCAGVTDAGFILRKEREDFNKVLDAKVKGTWYLDQFTIEDNLDFMMLCSSAMSYIGEVGQSDYVAANTYLEAFSEYRNLNNRKTFCINWVSWKEVGMSVRFGINKDDFTKVLGTQEAISKLLAVMAGTNTRVMIGKYNFEADNIKILVNSRCTIAENILSRAGIYNADGRENNKVIEKVVIMPHHQTRFFSNVKPEDVILNGKAEEEITSVERNIAIIYSSILGYKNLDLYDNFFEMGGDSIMIVKVHEEIEKIYPNTIISTDLFEYSTIESLASYIEKKNRIDILHHDDLVESNEANIKKVSEYPLSFAQRRILFEDRKYTGKKYYNNPFAFSVNKHLTLEQLTQYAEVLAERHEALRTSFQLIDGSMQQVIRDKVDIIVNYIDCTNVTDLDLRDYLYSFNLAKAPLFRINMLETKNDLIVLFDVHHIIVDGLATRILIKELAQLITHTPLEPVEYQYRDFVELEIRNRTSQHYFDAENYWKHVVKGIEPCPQRVEKRVIIELGQEYVGIYDSISNELENKLLEYAKRAKISLFTIYLGAFYITIHRITKQNNISIGIVTLGRDEISMMKIVGNFVNVLPVSINVDDNIQVDLFYETLFKKVQETFKYKEYPFNKIAKLAKKEYGISELFNIMFEYENTSMNLLDFKSLNLDIEGKTFVVQQNGYRSNLDIKINKYENEFKVCINYDNTLYTKEYIVELLRGYKEVLAEVIK